MEPPPQAHQAPDEGRRENRVKVCVWVPPEKLEHIDAAAGRIGQRRSPFMLQAALRFVESMEKA
jgi:uncharacterized protein (DUF1778 family)